MLQECVLGPGPSRVAGWGLWGVRPVPVPCQVMFMQWVLEGVLFLFFSSPFPFPLLYVTVQIFGLSQLGVGVGGVSLAARRSWGPSLYPPGAAACREGRQGIGHAETTHTCCTGERWPGLAWEVSAEAVGTTSLPPQWLPALDPASQSPAVGWMGTPVGGCCLVSHRFSPFPDHFASPMATLLVTCSGKGAGSPGTPSTLQGVALTPNQLKGLAQEGLNIAHTGAFTSGNDPPWAPGPRSPFC